MNWSESPGRRDYKETFNVLISQCSLLFLNHQLEKGILIGVKIGN